ncbi:MAG TPA: hypothetical protein VMK12_24760 [Anaeromyxobacteraceae bacterium]|nr:hypothetical protein [Anaeromyxobacteraceae bacterium]
MTSRALMGKTRARRIDGGTSVRFAHEKGHRSLPQKPMPDGVALHEDNCLRRTMVGATSPCAHGSVFAAASAPSI